MQMGILSNWGYYLTGDKWSDGGHVAKSRHPYTTTVVTWRSLGIPLQQWCEYDCGYTCKWEYSLTGDTISLGTNGQMVVTWQSLGIPIQQWCKYDCGYTSKWGYFLTGDTLTLGTNGRMAVTWRSLGIPLQQWCEYNCGYTCKWGYSLTGIHSHCDKLSDGSHVAKSRHPSATMV